MFSLLWRVRGYSWPKTVSRGKGLWGGLAGRLALSAAEASGFGAAAAGIVTREVVRVVSAEEDLGDLQRAGSPIPPVAACA